MAAGPIVGIGELLWDLLPAGPQPGGAPFNFAFHCHQLGHEAVIISRVGDDELGRRLLHEVRSRGLTDEFIQVDLRHPTGTVNVQVDAHGQPTYSIPRGVGYDFLELTPAIEKLATMCSAVYFGTLAQRHEHAHSTIQRFVYMARTNPVPARIVFDINLRLDQYHLDALDASMKQTDWLKLNDDELSELGRIYRLHDSTALQVIRDLAQHFENLELTCLTRGKDGCQVWARGEEVVDQPGIRVTVLDTVGAGDAFTAGLLTQTMEGKTLDEAVRFASSLAALVASRAGGTPRVDREEIEARLC